MNQIHSFCINEYKEKKYVKLDKRKNDCQLYCSEHQKKYYIDILNDEKDYILGNCHKYIDFFIDNDKNIFNGDLGTRLIKHILHNSNVLLFSISSHR